LDQAAKVKGTVVFHAGTKRSQVASRKSQVKYLTSGGRVLGVNGLGTTIKQAVARAYQAVGKINFPGMQYRNDIGARAIR